MAVMVLALVASACGSTANRGGHTVSPLASLSTPAASGSPVATASTTATASGGLNCRLPIVTTDTGGQVQHAGFLSIPSGTFAPDPRGTPAPKPLNYGLAFDRGYDKWLPVNWRLVSDDGSRYVYADYPNPDPLAAGAHSVIHIVNVATGADRVLASSGQYIIMDYTGNDVYLTQWVGGHDGPGPQVQWVLNPSTGVVTALPGGPKYGYWVSAGAGWRTDYNTADPTVHNGPSGGNRLIRIDLATGAETTWLYQQGADWVQVLGFDLKGHPIVGVGAGNTITIWLLSDVAHRSQIASGPAFYSGAVGDSNGIWLSGSDGTYLYTPIAGLQKMATTGGQIAAGCH
ncbi:MAG TPA: hypothetical protein VM674_05835 [Candidatus Acidoferrum sp.]|nr:hypothetical protein [Candidatus Acidoferrum sp.]